MTNNSESTDQQTPIVPKKYAGKWIAWDHGHPPRIIASGEHYAPTRQAAIAAGEADPLMDKVPSAAVRFIGAGAT